MSTKVTEIRVSRLFSTGQYEHERIEVVVSDPEGISFPTQTLTTLRDAVEACRTPKMSRKAELGLEIEQGKVNVVPDGASAVSPWDDTQATESEAKEARAELEKHRSLVKERQSKIDSLNRFYLGGDVTVNLEQ